MGAWDLLWEELLSSSGEKIHNSSKGNFVFFSFSPSKQSHPIATEKGKGDPKHHD